MRGSCSYRRGFNNPQKEVIRGRDTSVRRSFRSAEIEAVSGGEILAVALVPHCCTNAALVEWPEQGQIPAPVYR